MASVGFKVAFLGENLTRPIVEKAKTQGT